MENDPKAKEVFDQEISPDDLDAVAGGAGNGGGCVRADLRFIYSGGFPNCAATVEDGSFCNSNDACYDDEVDYRGMEDCVFVNCNKAWK